MSERIQQNATKRVQAARRREQNARERAQANEDRGNAENAHRHRVSAELQADAASDAETLLELDKHIEGDRLEG
jgi:hypothetical protein